MGKAFTGPLVADFFVVAPDHYRDLARLIVHTVGKRDIAAAFWSTAQYEETEVKLSGAQKVLFVGDEEENRPSKVYRPELAYRVSAGGSLYGWDGPKAVVCGVGADGLLYWERLTALRSEAEALKKHGPLFELPEFILSDLLRFILLGSIGFFMYKRRLLKQLRAAQTALAAETFITTHLAAWLEGKPLEQNG